MAILAARGFVFISFAPLTCCDWPTAVWYLPWAAQDGLGEAQCFPLTGTGPLTVSQ